MAIQWESEEERPRLESSSIRLGNVYLAVEDQGDNVWRYVAVNLGKFSNDPFAKCLEEWPREAIRRLRNELNKLETMLEERGPDETSLEGRRAESGATQA